MLSLVNGNLQKTIPISSRLSQFGDGIFETCLLKNRVVLFWQYHFKRLSIGAEVLNINLPKEDVWLADIAKLLRVSRQKNGVVKLMLSRTSSERGYTPQTTKALRIASIYPLPKTRKTTVEINICASGFSSNKTLAGIKHCNRLDNILASSNIASGFDDCIMLDDKKQIISTTRANIFLVKNAEVFTPKIDVCGIEGTKKALIIELAYKLKLPLKQVIITLKELNQADEVFISNSIDGIVAVKKILNTNYNSKTITSQLQTASYSAFKNHRSHAYF